MSLLVFLARFYHCVKRLKLGSLSLPSSRIFITTQTCLLVSTLLHAFLLFFLFVFLGCGIVCFRLFTRKYAKLFTRIPKTFSLVLNEFEYTKLFLRMWNVSYAKDFSRMQNLRLENMHTFFKRFFKWLWCDYYYLNCSFFCRGRDWTRDRHRHHRLDPDRHHRRGRRRPLPGTPLLCRSVKNPPFWNKPAIY